ncbi:Shedu immune nuclease family protein [Nonomuraea wenchangensis]
MSEDKITIRSTSKQTADAAPLVLREGEQIRLIFKATLASKEGATPTIRGRFIYQKKRRAKIWQDFNSINLASLKDGEGVRLDLKSDEVIRLYNFLQELYSVAEKFGIPRGQADFIRAPRNESLRQLLQDGNLDDIFGVDSHGGIILQRFLDWVTQRQSAQLASVLGELDSAQLLNFDAAVGAARLNSFVKEFDENRERNDEDYWQKFLTNNSWILAQLFTHPILLIRGQAYVGGKGIDNRDGNIVDFLLRNSLTEDTAIVEIKTPQTNIFRAEQYRNNTWHPSEELSGAVQQALVNKRSLMDNYEDLQKEDDPSTFKAFNPKALLIVGSIQRELTVTSKRRCFELYRRNLRDVEIVTFDEVYNKARQFIALLEEG